MSKKSGITTTGFITPSAPEPGVDAPEAVDAPPPDTGETGGGPIQQEPTLSGAVEMAEAVKELPETYRVKLMKTMRTPPRIGPFEWLMEVGQFVQGKEHVIPRGVAIALIEKGLAVKVS